MKNPHTKVELIKDGLENLTSLTQEFVKLSVYLFVLVIVTSLLIQWLRLIGVEKPLTTNGLLNLRNVPDEYISSEKTVGVYKTDNRQSEKEMHFGQLLPVGNEHRDFENEEHQIVQTRKLLDTVSRKNNDAVRDARYEEARMSIKKARQLVASGNKKLAAKLFQHALALEREFPDALIMYGEFLEDENIVQADLLYQRALTYEPSHSTALANRERTMPLVEELDKNMFLEIDKKKTELYRYPPNNYALRKAMKEFYYQHIYHTVALEGNTLTIDEIRKIIDSRRVVPNKSIYEHSEVIGVDEALKYLNNTLLINLRFVSIENIKEIHKRVIGFVDPVNAGVFRTKQVFVGKHIPPHPDMITKYMEEFNEWLSSEETQQLHPVEFAALAHYKLVYIHPFLDGNGRTSRLLMNLILMKHGFPPVSIQVSDRWEYYECLEAANEGDVRPFIRFIARCTAFTLDDYLFAAQDPKSYPELQGSLSNYPKVIETTNDET